MLKRRMGKPMRFFYVRAAVPDPILSTLLLEIRMNVPGLF